MINIKLECLQSVMMIVIKLIELLVGIIFLTAKNTGSCSGRNVMKLWENASYYETTVFTKS